MQDELSLCGTERGSCGCGYNRTDNVFNPRCRWESFKLLKLTSRHLREPRSGNTESVKAHNFTPHVEERKNVIFEISRRRICISKKEYYRIRRDPKRGNVYDLTARNSAKCVLIVTCMCVRCSLIRSRSCRIIMS